MRRTRVATVSTLAGATVLVGLRLAGLPLLPAASADEVPAGAAGCPTPSPSTVPSSSPTPSGTPSPSGQPSPTPTPSTTPSVPPTGSPLPSSSTTATASPSPSCSPTATPTGPNGVFKGTAIKNPYGTVQTTITYANGKITVATATFPATGESGKINNKAVPILRQETLAAQSAKINAVSGATYTSTGYKQSLQAAIDAAHK